MRRILTLLIAGLAFAATAQESGKFRLGIEGFFAKPPSGNGVGVAIEPKVAVADDMTVGLRVSAAYVSRNDLGALYDYYNDPYLDESLYVYDEKLDDMFFSVAGTFDYHFDDLTGGSFVPFAGAGLQYTAVSNDYYESSGLGGLLRAGFEWGKLRVYGSYNFVKSAAYAGAPGNNYLEVGLGFYIGGGKW